MTTCHFPNCNNPIYEQCLGCAHEFCEEHILDEADAFTEHPVTWHFEVPLEET